MTLEQRVFDLAERLAVALIENEVLRAKLRKEQEKTAALEKSISDKAAKR